MPEPDSADALRDHRRNRPGVDIYLVRHGETEWNAEGRFQGALDSPLTESGRAQALRIGHRLAALFPNDAPRILVSPLGRTRDTASLIARCWQTEPRSESPATTVETSLRELSLGAWDGLTFADIDAMWPDRLVGTTRHDWYFRAPGGESYDAAIARIGAWLDRLDGPVIAVTHGQTGRLIRGVHAGLDRETMLSLPIPQGVIWHLQHGEIRAIPA